MEKRGFDSIWFPDHLMGIWSQSVWETDIIPVAAFQGSPSVFLETMISMTLAAQATEGIKVGSSVTEIFRRHPAMLAQSILTIDHVSEGETVLGIGAGEAENIIPYGLDFSKPVSRLEEALQIIKLLWESEPGEVINFDGEFWDLEDAVFDLPLYQDTKPEIWIGAHGSRMLELVGRYGDGWLPVMIRLSVESYGKKLSRIKKVMNEEGRDPSDLTAGLFASVIIGESEEECLEIMDTPAIKSRCITIPSDVWEKVGASHPLGENSHGLTDYIPSKLSKNEVLEIIDSVPLDLVKEAYLFGTVEDVVRQIEEYIDQGLEHLVLWNETFLGDPEKFFSSEKLIDEVLKYFKKD